MRCAVCGHEAIPGERFCEACGKPLDSGNAPDDAAPPRESGPALIAPRRRRAMWAAGVVISLAVLLAGLAFVWRSHAAKGATQVADANDVAASGSNGPQPSGAGNARPADSAGYQKMSDQLSHLNGAVDVLNGKVNRSLFEIDALADTLGSNPTTSFRFVRDQIRYEPYVGTLRGAIGTLVCRAGNSLDRSLLLAALLQKAGFTVQIANGKLSDADARVLAQRTFEPAKPMPGAIADSAGLTLDLAQALGVDEAKLRQVAQQESANAALGRARLLAYADSESKAIIALLSQAHVDSAILTSMDRLVAEASDHYWVRYQDASGRWIDLDPAFANAEPGQTRTAAARTFAPDAVPDELYHHLRVALVLRVASATGSDTGSDQILLDEDLRIADLQGKSVVVMSQPVPRLDPLKAGVTLMDILDSAKVYQTMLVVGGDEMKGKGFDLHGHVGDVTSPDALGSDIGVTAGNANRGLFGAIAGATSGDTAPKSDTRIVGEWVEYTLTSPGLGGAAPEEHTYRRDIIAPFTVTSWSTSPDKRRVTPTHLSKEALHRRLMWSAELLPVSGTAIPEYAGYLQLRALLASRSMLDASVKLVNGLPIDPSSLSNPPTASIHNAVLAEGILYLSGGITPAAIRTYFAQPGLVAYETRVTDADKAALTEGYDIVTFPPRTVANSGTSSNETRMQGMRIDLQRGILATRLESMLMTGKLAPTRQVVVNATKVFTAAERQGVPMVVLGAGSAGGNDVASLSTPDSVKAQLAEELANGGTVIVPAREVTVDGRAQIGWWRWEPSGELIGIMPGGRGQGMAEYSALIAAGIGNVWCIAGIPKDDPLDIQLGKVMVCTGATVMGGYGGLVMAEDALWGGILTITAAALGGVPLL